MSYVSSVGSMSLPRRTSRWAASTTGDRQVELLGELEVALVVRRHGHDRAGAVARQHVVGDPDRDLLVVDRIDGVRAGEHAGLLSSPARCGRGRSCGAACCLVRLDRVGLLSRRRELRRPADAPATSTMYVAPNSVSGRVVKTRSIDRRWHRDAVEREVDLRALAAADPVALQRLDRSDQSSAPGRHQPVGIGGDAQHPLPQRLRDDRVVAALAPAVDDFLVGQHRAQRRAPVDRRFADTPAGARR